MVIKRMKAVKDQLKKLHDSLSSSPLATAMLRQLRLASYRYELSEAGVDHGDLELGPMSLDDYHLQPPDNAHIKEVDFDGRSSEAGRTDPDRFVQNVSDMITYIDAQVASYAEWRKINGGPKRSRSDNDSGIQPHPMDVFGRHNRALWDDMVRQLYSWFERHLNEKPSYQYPDAKSPFRSLVSEIEVTAGFEWEKADRLEETQIEAIKQALSEEGPSAWGIRARNKS